MGHKLKNTIRVNKTNSIVLNDVLYITLLKAHKIASRVLQPYIEYQGNYIVHPTLGKCVQYNGAYRRS
jgi:hypothetical protein